MGIADVELLRGEHDRTQCGLCRAKHLTHDHCQSCGSKKSLQQVRTTRHHHCLLWLGANLHQSLASVAVDRIMLFCEFYEPPLPWGPRERNPVPAASTRATRMQSYWKAVQLEVPSCTRRSRSFPFNGMELNEPIMAKWPLSVFVWRNVILPDNSGSYHAVMKARETSRISVISWKW